jgi:Derlin-1
MPQISPVVTRGILAVQLLIVLVAGRASHSTTFHGRPRISSSSILPISNHANFHSPLSRTFLNIRGGASPSKQRKPSSKTKRASSSLASARSATGSKKVGAAEDKPSAMADALKSYRQILPLTRIYLTLVVVTTLSGLLLGGELAQALYALDPIRTWYGMELWRPLTAACFLGPPNLGWLFNGYYLYEYGSSLERAYGTPQHLVFLALQVVLLCILCVLTGSPFFAQSVITAMLHVLSRAMPHQKVKWLIFTVPYWSLPYGLMVADVLQTGSGMAALPHILGILSGHFYQFHKFIWPKMDQGGEDWLIAPDCVVQRLDPNARPLPESSSAKAAATRKRSKGRKLGSL